MLNQPTLEKLRALRLQGMAEAFRAQSEQTGIAELSFEAGSRCSSVSMELAPEPRPGAPFKAKLRIGPRGRPRLPLPAWSGPRPVAR